MHRIHLGLVGLIVLLHPLSCRQPAAPCVRSSECRPDEICVAETCRRVCNSAAGCEDGERCRDGVCVPGSVASPDAGPIDVSLADAADASWPADANSARDRASWPDTAVPRDVAGSPDAIVIRDAAANDAATLSLDATAAADTATGDDAAMGHDATSAVDARPGDAVLIALDAAPADGATGSDAAPGSDATPALDSAPEDTSGPYCGNGAIDRGEDCDEGQWPPRDGDGCSAICELEANSLCTGTPSVCEVDAEPDPLVFVDVPDAAIGALYTSNAVVLSGFHGSLPAVLQGAGSAVLLRNGSPVATGSISVQAGDVLALQRTSATAPLTTLAASVTVGGALGDWVVTTRTLGCPGSMTLTQPGETTFVMPSPCQQVAVLTWGGGGGAGRRDGTALGGAGGGGGFATSTLTPSSDAEITIHVGGGGQGGGCGQAGGEGLFPGGAGGESAGDGAVGEGGGSGGAGGLGNDGGGNGGAGGYGGGGGGAAQAGGNGGGGGAASSVNIGIFVWVVAGGGGGGGGNDGGASRGAGAGGAACGLDGQDADGTASQDAAGGGGGGACEGTTTSSGLGREPAEASRAGAAGWGGSEGVCAERAGAPGMVRLVWEP